MKKTADKENYILTYYQKISDGTITVGKWVKLVYEMIIKGLENKSFFYAYTFDKKIKLYTYMEEQNSYERYFEKR